MESVFENVYLISKIQHYLSFEELLTSRLIATNWNYSAMNYLKKSTIRISSEEKLNELLLVLKSSNQRLPLKYCNYELEDIPIWKICPQGLPLEIPMNKQTGVIEQILDKIGRYLVKLKLGLSAEHMLIGNEIFQKINKGLQVLHIESQSKYICVDVSQMKFPGLKKLKLQNCSMSTQLNLDAKMSLKTIQIQNCKMDPYFLIEWLNGCVNLQCLELDDENFSPPSPKHRITLPNLTQFHLSSKPFSINEWKNCYGQCCAGGSEEYLESLLFFDKVDNKNWRIENILTLKINVKLEVDWRSTILKIDHNKGEIGGSHYAVKSILENLHDFQLYGLELYDIWPNIDRLPSNLKRLSLCSKTSFSADEVHSILQRCNKLEELTLVGCRTEPGGCLCLDDIPPTLKQLTLRCIGYTYSPNVTVNLDYLFLDYDDGSPVDGEAHRRFSEIFKVKYLYLQTLCVCSDLVQDILTTECVEYIVLSTFCDKTRNNCEILHFTLQNSFVNIYDNIFYLKRKDGVWHADSFKNNPIPYYEKESTGIIPYGMIGMLITWV